jgi:hypothetical protein
MTCTSGGGGGASFFTHPLANNIRIEKQRAQMNRALGGGEYCIHPLLSLTIGKDFMVVHSVLI